MSLWREFRVFMRSVGALLRPDFRPSDIERPEGNDFYLLLWSVWTFLVHARVLTLAWRSQRLLLPYWNSWSIAKHFALHTCSSDLNSILRDAIHFCLLATLRQGNCWMCLMSVLENTHIIRQVTTGLEKIYWKTADGLGMSWTQGSWSFGCVKFQHKECIYVLACSMSQYEIVEAGAAWVIESVDENDVNLEILAGLGY